jgi:signal transduction histidine kinase
LQPVHLHFWQKGWFLTVMLSLCGAALGLSLVLATKVTMQSRARQMLALERARIARDVHDDLGSALTQIVLQSEIALMEVGEASPVRARLDQLWEKARDSAQALDEVIWTVNSHRDTLRELASYLCKYARKFLQPTPIRCRFDVPSDLPPHLLDLPVRRGLLLAVKEALNNAAKHSQATELCLRLRHDRRQFAIVVEDNGRGFDPAALTGERNGLRNLRQRMDELGGEFRLTSRAGAGCRVEFVMPFELSARHPKFWWRLRPRRRLRDAARAPQTGDLRASATHPLSHS